ncbi:MAG: response regulator [Deltaproteobacteria bacterium]|nr:MAG: response regulator [Deltaproteobacteria bacterium]
MTTKKVLLVDDMMVFLEMGRNFLERSGCQVLTAKSGTEALEKIRSEAPDLVLLDLEMPDMNGDRVCELVKKDKKLKKIPIMMLSSRGDKEAIDKCQEAGCDNYLTKPITQRDLLDETAKILKIPQRKDIRITVRMKVEGVSWEDTFYGESENISIGGILVKSEAPLKEGSVINLRFLLPDQQYQIEVEVEGEVVRIDKENFEPEYGLGIAFRDLNAVAREMIKDFIKKKEEQA